MVLRLVAITSWCFRAVLLLYLMWFCLISEGAGQYLRKVGTGQLLIESLEDDDHGYQGEDVPQPALDSQSNRHLLR